MIFSSVKLCVKMCWRKHSVLELIFNFLLLPVSSFILQIPRMMNYRKRLISPSFLWQFWAKLPGLLFSAVKFIARARVSVFTRCLETSPCPGLEYHGPNWETTEDTTYTCPLKHEMTLSIFVNDNCCCFKWWFSFRILYLFCLCFSCFCFSWNTFCIFSTAVRSIPIIPDFSERCGL